MSKLNIKDSSRAGYPNWSWARSSECREIQIEDSDEILDFAFDRNNGEERQGLWVNVTNPETGRRVEAALTFEYDRNQGLGAFKITR